MFVVHLAFECSPIYKTGGLGDVAGSLPIALEKLGIKTAVIMPRYSFIKQIPKLPNSRVPVWYVESQLFDKRLLKHNPKHTAVAFAIFAQKALRLLKEQMLMPSVIHCHDWHAALIPAILKTFPDPFFLKTKTVLTIHNSAYQGVFAKKYLDTLETGKLLSLFPSQSKRISFLQTGITHADFVTTVSPTFAKEMLRGSASFGMKQLLKSKRGRFVGILNGIDYGIWNPTFTASGVFIAKSAQKKKLQQQLGLKVDTTIPLFGFIARLTKQKGIELLLPLMNYFVEHHLQLVILGTGQKEYETALKHYTTGKYREWISIHVTFDEALARQIYAASTFFLIPSLFEPCGLTQMIAMKYGSIPIVSPVGGLKDSVKHMKTGIVLSQTTSRGLSQALDQAHVLWKDPAMYKKLVQRILQQDFSWVKSAGEYAKLYNGLLKLSQ